ncbi:MAG: arginase [Microbacteriaceae bacterium]|jgi:arginase|nr:arginase [Microbacteriaceae bacterium]MDQ1549181.1 arginase [Microbacteriaceae bacterium]MDQ1554383.1 arginase [Microbacteriaceae bacterium]
MRLVDGAAAIRGDLPSASTIAVDIPLGAGNDQGTLVQRLSSLIQVRDTLLLELETVDGIAITIGGDCGVDLAGVSHANAANESMAVVWLDAHPDANTPESSPSGAFHGMVLRTLLGDGTPELVPQVPLAPQRVILGGTRAQDDVEAAWLEDSGVRILSPTELTPGAITDALLSTGATSVYLHIDLDVLDPGEIAGIGYPEPFGVELGALLEVITAIKAALPLVGAAITEFAPASIEEAGDDLGSILRILGALTA